MADMHPAPVLSPQVHARHPAQRRHPRPRAHLPAQHSSPRPLFPPGPDPRCMLDIPPSGGIHDRAPIYLGSKQEVDKIEALYKELAK